MSLKMKFLFQIILLAIFCLPFSSTGFITNLGFWHTTSGGGGGSGGTYNYAFSSGAFNVNLLSEMNTNKVALGWDGVSASTFNITINSGVTFGSADPTSPAFIVPVGFPVGSTINITNHGTIIGAGGNANSGIGGDAIWLNYPVTLISDGTISGGGGGGGRGGDGCGTSGSAGGPGAGNLAVAPANATTGATGVWIGSISGGAGSNTGSGAVGNPQTQAGDAFGTCYWDDGYGGTGYNDDTFGSGGGGGAPGYSGGQGGSSGTLGGASGWALLGSGGIVNAGWATTGTFRGNNTVGASAARPLGAPSFISVNGGNNQTGPVSYVLPAFIAVVKDYNGNLISNTQVNWSLTSGSGTLTNSSNNTDTSGLSRTQLVPASTGNVTVTATVASTSASVIFNVTISAVDPCLGNCTNGMIYIGALSPGATSGSGTDRYMTTPSGCGQIPAGQIVGVGDNAYASADFTPTCSGTDSLNRTWNDGSSNWYVVPGLANYSTLGANDDANYGSTNTTNIAAITAAANGGYHAAARYCDKLSYGGYTDWYLPNRAELNLMYINKANIPGLDVSGSWYWSSTQTDQIKAWDQNMSNGGQDYTRYKYDHYRVRCVRRF